MKRHLQIFLFIVAVLSATSLCASAQTKKLIDSPEHEDANKSPFKMNRDGLTNLGFPFYASAYTTGNVVVVTTDDVDYQIFHPDGRPVVEGSWKIAGPSVEGLIMENGTMIAKKADISDNHLYIIREDGTVKQLPETVIMSTSFRDGVAIATVKGAKPYEYLNVYIDTDGKQLPSPAGLKAELIQDHNSSLRSIPPLRDGLRAYFDEESRKWGYVDAHGKVVIQPTFNKARSFSEGMAPVQVGNTIYYINQSGQPANGLKFTTNDVYLCDVSDYSNGVCVANYPSKSPEYLRTYYDIDGNIVGQLRQGTPFHNGTLYYMGNDGKGSYYPFSSEKVGSGVQEAKRATSWFTGWDDNGPLPRYDEYGVGHTDNKYVTVGRVRPDNQYYKFAYSYFSDFSKGGYAIVYLEDEGYKYKGVVDISGNILSLISMEKR